MTFDGRPGSSETPAQESTQSATSHVRTGAEEAGAVQ